MRNVIALLSVLAATRAVAAPARSRIALKGNNFDVRGLPALSARGTLVAVAVIDPDGDRGFPNLQVVFFPIDGRPPSSTVVLTVAEVEELGDKQLAAGLVDKIEPRLDLVNAQLSVAGFAPLKAIDSRSADLKLAVHDGALEIGGRQEVGADRVPLSTWRAGCAEANAPFVSGMWATTGDARDTVVRIDFSGSADCAEPRTVWRVLRAQAAPSVVPDPGLVPAPAVNASREASMLNTRAMRKFRAKDWAGAAADFRAAIERFSDHVKAHYNLACLASITGDRATVLEQLRWLAASNLAEAEARIVKARTDPDLDFVRDDPEVQEILSRAPARLADR